MCELFNQCCQVIVFQFHVSISTVSKVQSLPMYMFQYFRFNCHFLGVFMQYVNKLLSFHLTKANLVLCLVSSIYVCPHAIAWQFSFIVCFNNCKFIFKMCVAVRNETVTDCSNLYQFPFFWFYMRRVACVADSSLRQTRCYFIL